MHATAYCPEYMSPSLGALLEYSLPFLYIHCLVPEAEISKVSVWVGGWMDREMEYSNDMIKVSHLYFGNT